jgi:ABC-type branched-subunit amino acid transport system ATPase component
MLETLDLTIRFGGHVAVNNVSCAFAPGTLTAIVGPNGAGKTTYFNLISGQLKASAGTVSLDGQPLSGLSPSARTHAGLGRAFQLTNLFPNLTVLENVRLAVQATREGAHRRGLNLWSIWSDHKALTERADQILADVALKSREHATVASLPHGDQRKLEVALADGAGAEGLHVRRTDGGHERGRGAGHPRPDPQAQAGQEQDDPAWSSTRWMWCANLRTGSSCCTTARWWRMENRPR